MGRGSLEKIMLDYVRWIFNIEFYTPRYVIMRELAKEKLRIGWGIRVMRYERRLKKRREGNLLRCCWKKKRINRRIYMVKKEKNFTIGMDGE